LGRAQRVRGARKTKRQCEVAGRRRASGPRDGGRADGSFLWCTSGTPPLPFWACLRVSLRSAPLGGKGLRAFLDFPHTLPHTVWVAVVSREQGGSPRARRYGLSPLGRRLFFPAIVAASRNNPIFAPDSRLTHKRKYGRTPHVPRKASFKAEESSLRGTVVGGCRVVVVAGERRTCCNRWADSARNHSR
jgi:hypothetical protein